MFAANLFYAFERKKRFMAQQVAHPENFGWGDEKIYKQKLRIISKFQLSMINFLDLEQTCWAYF